MDNRIQTINIKDEMKRSYINYSMSVILSRALPDVRDGLKPVQRRIIYALNELHFTSDKQHRKSATIVGEVIGKYHPHGDSSIYSAIVKLAQPFNTRYPLIDSQGNFGSIDGDGPAAMRYTEARMSGLSEQMLKDINKNTVNFYPNFDETTVQPEVLPSRFPNLLVNGSTGIAVGMATSIPPHNLAEVIDATIYLIDNPQARVEDLLKFIKGPDFPTGAIVLGSSSMVKAYKSGHGKVKVRSKARIENYNNKDRIIIEEIPYMVNKSSLLFEIANLVKSKKIEGITELRDESNRKGIRVVIELRRDVNANVILNLLYKYTSLQTSFSMIFLAIENGQPKTFSLQEMLSSYVRHQREVETRRVQFDLEKATARAHIVEGLIKALDHIDEVISIIRNSYDDAKERLIERFELSPIQAQSILDMQLNRLQGLEYEKFENELEELNKKISYFNELLSDDKKLMSVVKEGLLFIKEKYADDRRTEISIDDNEIDIEDLIDKEDIIITITNEGYIKRVSQNTYNVQKRGGKGIIALSTKEEDEIKNIISASTHDNLLFFTNTGRVFRDKAYKIPDSSRQSKGIPIINLLKLQDNEYVEQIVVLNEESDGYLIIATKGGRILKTPIEHFKNINSNGKKAIKFLEDDSIISANILTDEDDIILTTKNGYAIRISVSSLNSKGRNGLGVRGIKLRGDDEVISLNVYDKDKYLLTISQNGYAKKVLMSNYKVQSRGGFGNINYKVNKNGFVAKTMSVNEDDQIMLINSNGKIIRINLDTIHPVGRVAKGVKIMKLEDQEVVVSASIVSDVEKEVEDGDEN